MKSVVKEWLSNDNISRKQQTVVLSSLRGCDGQSKYDLSKKLTRQLRSAILYNAAAADTTFMRDTMTLEEVRKLAEDSDKYPIHYYMHALHACEIIGFKHPDNEIREWFNGAYLIMVDALHLKPETEEECDYRLRDGINTPFTEIEEDEN
ncbi:MAG: hypothetical protein WCX15_00515 [Bacilli bacterium]